MLGVVAVMELDTIICYFAKIEVLNVTIYQADDAMSLTGESNLAAQAYGLLMFILIFGSLNYNYFTYICNEDPCLYQDYWGRPHGCE
mgnify:CR=1 FL=1